MFRLHLTLNFHIYRYCLPIYSQICSCILVQRYWFGVEKVVKLENCHCRSSKKKSLACSSYHSNSFLMDMRVYSYRFHYPMSYLLRTLTLVEDMMKCLMSHHHREQNLAYKKSHSNLSPKDRKACMCMFPDPR